MPNATKTTAARSPAKKTAKTAKPAKKTTPAVVVEDPPATKAKTPVDVITFLGRDIRIVVPTPEKIDVWNRMVPRLQAAGNPKTNTSPADLLKLQSRATKLILSVMADEDDRDWLDDQFLETDLTLEGAAEIITLAVERYPNMLKAMGASQAPRNGPQQPKAQRRR